MDLKQYIDHTLLKATASDKEIKALCQEAIDYNFYAVCVNSSYVPLASKELSGTTIKLAAVAGFPLGAMSAASKVAEAKYSVDNGADEIDVVMNLGYFKSGWHKQVTDELSLVKQSIGEALLIVIIETCYLSEKEIEIASRLVLDSGADFVKTSTGFGSRGASFEDVITMKRVVGDQIRIKASGGIRDRETALKYIELGASRLGTSSGIKIIDGS